MNITGFNNKLQATGFEVKKGVDKYIDKEYRFYEDGSLKFIDDGLNETFDRSYKYDALGRTVEGKAGIAARGGTSGNQHKLDQPYSMQFQYDAFGHITNKTGYYYSSPDTNTYSYNAATDRNPSWNYDADGNTRTDQDGSYTYDAAGQIVKTNAGNITDDYFDGDGKLLKRITNVGSTNPAERKFYLIRSSVLNKVISEADATGKKKKTFVPANGTTLATQEINPDNVNTPIISLSFNHTDPSGTGAQRTTASGGLYDFRTGEYSPLGRNVGDFFPYITLNTLEPEDEGGANLFGSGGGYRPGKQDFELDGVVVPESVFMGELLAGHSGGIFGLVERAARMSTREVGKWYRETTWTETRGEDVSFHANSVYLRTVYNSNWSAIASLATLAGRQTKQTKINEKDVAKLRLGVKDRWKDGCKSFIESVLNKAKALFPNQSKLTPSSAIESFSNDILDIFDDIAKNQPTGGFLSGGIKLDF